MSGVAQSAPPPVLGSVGLFLMDDRRRIPLLRRRGSHGAGEWGLPGGKVDFGETIPEAACRECLEELGIRVDPRTIRIGPAITDYWPKDRKHFIDIFCSAPMPAGAVPRVMEPEKADGVAMFLLDDLLHGRNLPDRLFEPVRLVLPMMRDTPFPFPYRDPLFEALVAHQGEPS